MPLGGFSLQGVSGLALGDFRVEPLRNFWFGLSGISGLSLPGISGLASPEFLVWPFREFLVSPFRISWLTCRPAAVVAGAHRHSVSFTGAARRPQAAIGGC